MRFTQVSAVILLATVALAKDRHPVTTTVEKTGLNRVESTAGLKSAQGKAGITDERNDGDVVDDDGGDNDDDDDDPPVKQLTGRFLHITDFHPDPHYLTGSTLKSGCHRLPDPDNDLLSTSYTTNSQLSKKRTGTDTFLAGKWGTSNSDCDTPLSLVNITLDWLNEEWKDEIDFVVWTGDSARHDIDREIPRTPGEIYELNRMMVRKMRETFGADMPVIPSMGNNDLYPHNIMEAGPNAVTAAYTDLWSHFIPSEQYHVFQRGAYFTSEVIPDHLAVISLNTMYWYDANKAVDGCKDGSDEPGALEFDWLEVQLEGFRERGMQVWLTGHVPPHRDRYFDNCYLRYGDLALRFQDTIVGHLYGHMNIDHFFFLDVEDLEQDSFTSSYSSSSESLYARPKASHDESNEDDENDGGDGNDGEEPLETLGRSSDTAMQQKLYDAFDDMPKSLKIRDYAVVNVGPSVVPTYLPSVRVFAYNVSGIVIGEERDISLKTRESTSTSWFDMRSMIDSVRGWTGRQLLDDETLSIETKKKKKSPKKKHPRRKKKKSDCSKPEHEDQPHCKFRRKPRYSSSSSPSRMNTGLTPLGYAQFYLPDLDRQKERPEWKLEYLTFGNELFRGRNGTQEGGGGDGDEDEGDGMMGRPLIPWHLLPGYKEMMEEEFITTTNDTFGSHPAEGQLQQQQQQHQKKKKKKPTGWKKFKHDLQQKHMPFKMKDLTIGSYAKFAARLVEDDKLWNEFGNFMYVSTVGKVED